MNSGSLVWHFFHSRIMRVIKSESCFDLCYHLLLVRYLHVAAKDRSIPGWLKGKYTIAKICYKTSKEFKSFGSLHSGRRWNASEMFYIVSLRPRGSKWQKGSKFRAMVSYSTHGQHRELQPCSFNSFKIIKKFLASVSSTFTDCSVSVTQHSANICNYSALPSCLWKAGKCQSS